MPIETNDTDTGETKDSSDYRERAEAFNEELVDLSKKHGIALQPEIRITNLGIHPVVTLQDIKSAENESKESDTADTR